MNHFKGLALFALVFAVGCDDGGDTGTIADATLFDIGGRVDQDAPRDQGRSDASPADQGRPDVAVPDATPGDAAPPDASPPDMALPCPSDDACGAGQWCNAGSCEDGCHLAPDDCGAGRRCDAATRDCVDCTAQDLCGDGIDNDCDGTADDGCDCVPDAACATQLSGPCGIGRVVCEGGAARCVPPSADEVCNGLDDDCDGSTDDGIPGLGDACAAGVGACARQGVMACTEGGQVACNVVAGAPAGELCNGLDDDCDGATDEAFPDLGEACTVGRGVCERAGVRVCQDANTTRCDAVAAQPGAEQCNTLDDDCDGRIDEGAAGQPLTRICYDGAPETENVSFCRSGQSTCENGQFGACEGQVLPVAEVCNGEDDDCDGRVDRTPDNQRLREACYAGPAGTSGVGACVGGTAECQFGRLGACVGQVIPAAEICDQADNDCNGTLDDVVGGCACEPGEARDCYPGPAGTAGRGLCRSGRQTCLADGSGFDACVGAILPTGELCDGLDNDCNGAADDAVAGIGQACTEGVGACAAPGTTSCNGSEITCDAVAGVPGAERCNGLDDNCDGRVDDGFNLGRDCESGIGACVAPGVNVCGPNGEATCSAVPAAPGVETCNGVDDDCDGTADDGLVDLGDCNSGRPGLCAEGTRTCVGGQERCEPAPPAEETCNNLDDDCDLLTDEDQGDQNCGVGICARVLPVCRNGAPVACDPLRGAVAEACNGLDDDCDGDTDEGQGLGLPCNDGVGVCSSPGVTICNVLGEPVCSGVAGQPRLEVCNLQDDDCDGTTDEDIEGVGDACGAGRGACRRDGQIQCADGVLGCSVVAGEPAVEICNGLDDNCDGLTDERLGVGNGCAAGVGECRRNGLMVCGAGGAVVCNAVPAAPGVETCNGFDDDCNGVVDNNAQGAGVACNAGIGGCLREGTVVCAQARLSCNAVPGQPNAEICDGIDNDCDRVVDDTPLDAGGACSEGQGACRANGSLVCVNGAIDCNAVPRQPSPEVCDNADQDCDGRSDEGEPDCDANGTLDTCDIQFGRRADCNFNGIPDGCDIAGGLADCDNDGRPDVCADACVADDQPPLVDLFVGGNPINAGTQIQVVVQAQDNVGVTECRLFVGAQEVPLDANCQAFVTFNQPGYFDVIGLASDARGNEGRDEVRMRVLDPNDVDAPAIAIHSPPNGSTIRQATAVVASISDPNLVEWVLYYGPQANPTQNVLARGAQNVNNQPIGVLDPGVIARGDYGLVLRAEDINGRARSLIGVFTIGVCEPVAESCDFVDNDCDGEVDEDFGNIGGACTVGTGACQRAGVMRCLQGGAGSACDGQPGQPVAETCNTLDDNCNGTTDEGFGAGVACQAGVGACVRAGLTVCNAAGNGVTCNAQPGQPAAAEACNGIDDNCNGSTDEGFDPFVCGQGRCRQTLAFCPGQPEPVCDPFLGARPEVCDGIDDDCDGQVDEQASDAGGPCTTGVGACEREGIEVCVGGDLTCNVQPGQPAAEVCNGEDDDCDGPVDEGNVCPDVTPPQVDLVLAPPIVNAGDMVRITVSANDDRGVVERSATLDGAPIQLDANGVANVVAPAFPGGFAVVGSARDAAGNVGQDRVVLRVRDPGDVTPPVIALSSPEEAVELTGPVEVRGTVQDQSLVQWTLSYGSLEGGALQTFAQGDQAVNNGLLATLPVGRMSNGYHRIRLEAEDASGLSIAIERVVQVNTRAKPGQIRFCVTDMRIDVSGLPITIDRCYDSFDKVRRPFGFGWSLDITSGSVTHNREVGLGWQHEPRCNRMIFGQCIDPGCAAPETLRHMTVSFTGGNRYFRFRPEIVNTQLLDGVCLGDVRWVAEAGTPAGWTLAPLGGNSIWLFPGENELLEQFDFVRYDPRRFVLQGPGGERIEFTQGAGIDLFNNGNGVELVFLPEGIIHSGGISVDFERNANQSITRITDPDGNAYVYQYDAAGNLVGVTDRVGATWRYRYDADHNLIAIIKPDGLAVEATYDAEGRLTGFGLPGRQAEMAYEPENQVLRVTDRNGDERVMVYDELGNVIEETDAEGNTTLREIDEDGRMTRQETPEGRVTTYSFAASGNKLPTRVVSPLGHVHENVLDAEGRLTQMRLPDGRTAELDYPAGVAGTSVLTIDGEVVAELVDDASGNTTVQRMAGGEELRYTYDQNGRKTSMTWPDGTVERFTYDGNGRILTHTERNGAVVRNTYDGEGRLVRVVDGCGGETRNTYDAMGHVTSIVDALGRENRIEYDAAGNRARMIQPDGQEVSWVYDAENRPLEDRLPGGLFIRRTYDSRGRTLTEQDSAGGITRNTYDGDGLLVETVAPHGIPQRMSYNAEGRSVTETFPAPVVMTRDSNGHVASLTDALGNVMRYEYTFDGKITREIFPDGTERNFEVDGDMRLLAGIDEAGHRTSYTRTFDGRVESTLQPDGTRWNFAHLGTGELARVTDPEGRNTRLSYDLCRRMTAVEHPDGATFRYAYDAVGNLTRIDHPGGTSVQRTYDAMDRMVREVRSDGSEARVTYTAFGLPATYTDDRGLTRFTYDAGARLTRMQQPDGAVLTFGYDVAGRRTFAQATTPAGDTWRLDYLYHPVNGMLAGIVQDNEVLVAYDYDEAARPSVVEYANGVRQVYQRDQRGREIRLTTFNAANEVLADRRLTREARGLVTRELDEAGVDRRYTYDSLERLVREIRIEDGQTVLDRTYTYDSRNNVASVTENGVALPRQHDDRSRLLTADGRGFAWDERGGLSRVTEGGEATDLTHDLEGRLVAVNGPGGARRYWYNHEGDRVAEEVDGQRTGHVVMPRQRGPEGIFRLSWTLVDYDAQGRLTRGYIAGPMLHGVSDADGTRYAIADPRGSVGGWLDDAGAVTARIDYDAWGAVVSGDLGPDQRGFLGMQTDPDTGLVHLRARTYDPAVGRFISPDPVFGHPLDPRTFATYSYGMNSPVTYIDPTGEFFSMGGLMTGLSIIGTLASIASISWRLWNGEKVAWWEFVLAALSCVVPVMQGAKLAYIIFSRSTLMRESGRWVWYHYTTAKTGQAILSSGKLIPGAAAGGKVWVTDVPPILMFNKWVGWYYQLTIGAWGGKLINFGKGVNATTELEVAVEFSAAIGRFRSAKMLNQAMAIGEEILTDAKALILH